MFIVGLCNTGCDALLTGSVSTELGERNGRKAGAGVTSLSNGIASFGSMLEGPLVGILFVYIGWQGVLALSCILSWFGGLAVLKAHLVLRAEGRKQYRKEASRKTQPESENLLQSV